MPISLKAQCVTRWESWINAVKPLYFHFKNITSALISLWEKSLEKTALEQLKQHYCWTRFVEHHTKWWCCFRWTASCSLPLLLPILWLQKSMQLTVFFETITKMVMPLLCQQYMKLQKKILLMKSLYHKCDFTKDVYLNTSPVTKFKYPTNIFIRPFFFYLSCWPGFVFN